MRPAEISVAMFLSRVAIAALLGIAIGFERQWRQRAAGLHTSSLVAVGASLFALLDESLGSGDTTRIVAGVVTGVGFIAGGVILRSGLNVSGLNTAATIWATAAVGALAGFGFWPIAASGAAGIIALNLLLQPLADAIDSRKGKTGDVVYTISVAGDRDAQSRVSDEILSAVSGSTLSLQSLARRNAEDEGVIDAEIFSRKPDDAKIETLTASLAAIPGVTRSDWRSAGS